jgi:hypothetical protein
MCQTKSAKFNRWNLAMSGIISNTNLNMKRIANRWNSRNLSGLKVATEYVRELLVAGPEGAVGKGMELGVGAMLARTFLKRLPVPFNFIVPLVTEKVIMKHGVETGREVLLKGLRWVKKATAERPEDELEYVASQI